MSFDIFDERFYVANNPDVASAIAAGFFSSGRQHFEQYGIQESIRAATVSPLYNEQFYLEANPDVAAAVNSGVFSSGLQHYIQYGEAEGRIGLFGLYNEQAFLQRYPDVATAVTDGTYSSGFQYFVQNVLPYGANDSRFDALFNEQYYLYKYPDVADAVAAGYFSSGLQHFLQFGLDEGRSGGSNFDEGFYLRKYPDVAAAVSAGSFSSGLEHFARNGEAEGRSGTSFDEDIYLALYPDLPNTVATGAEYYLEYGQYEDSSLASTLGIFSGTSGNDIVRSFGGDTVIAGVDADASTLSPGSLGVGEVDLLIGLGDGSEIFSLGIGSDASTGAQKFYVGNGSSDYALIRYFDAEQDFVLLSGDSSEYIQTVVNGSLNISTNVGDLVGIVEGYTSTLNVFTENAPAGTFFLAQ